MHTLKYTDKDRKRFSKYFEPKQKKRKAGRPKKKKRKHNKKKKRKSEQQQKDNDVPKARRRLFEDICAGEVAKAGLKKPTRVNWDVEPNFSFRDRLATSWITQTDLWRVGEKFCRFAKRCGIDRKVLSRYIAKVKRGVVKKPRGKKRGRKSMLSESVIRHLCEG